MQSDNSVRELSSMRESENFLIEIIQEMEGGQRVPQWKESVTKDKGDYDVHAFLEHIKNVGYREMDSSRDSVLIVGHDGLVIHMGIYHAIATEKRAFIVQPKDVLATCQNLIEQTIDSITILGLYHDISYELLFSIQKLLGENHFETSLGLIVAETEVDLGYRIYKSAMTQLYPRKQDVLALTLTNETYEDYDDVSVFTAANLSYAALSSTLKERLRSFNIISHGRDDSVVVADALLCGRFSGDLPPLTAGRVPQCAHNHQCFRSGVQLIQVKDIDSQVVFLNSCLPFKLREGNFNQDYLLSHSLLRGKAAALIASPFIKEAQIYENMLFQHLLDTGKSLGEVTSLLNKTLLHNEVDFPQHFLHGDPKIRFKTKHSPASKVIWDGTGVLRVNGQEQRFMMIELPDSCFAEKVKNHLLQLTIVLKKKKTTYYNIIRVKNKSIIYVYAMDDLGDFSISFVPFVQEEKRTWKRLRALQTLTNLNINIPKLNSVIKEITSTLKHMSRLIGPATNEVMAAQKLHQRRKTVQELLTKCDRMLIEHVLEEIERKVIHFSDTYRDGTSTPYMYDQYKDCPYCAQKCLRLRFDHKIFESMERQILMCPVCGVVLDSPVQPIEITIDSSHEVKRGEPTNVQVKIENLGEECFAGFVGLRVIDGQRHGVAISPDVVPISIEPCSKLSCSFDVTVGRQATQHQHWFSSFIILDSEVYNARKNIWIK